MLVRSIVALFCFGFAAAQEPPVCQQIRNDLPTGCVLYADCATVFCGVKIGSTSFGVSMTFDFCHDPIDLLLTVNDSSIGLNITYVVLSGKQQSLCLACPSTSPASATLA